MLQVKEIDVYCGAIHALKKISIEGDKPFRGLYIIDSHEKLGI